MTVVPIHPVSDRVAEARLGVSLIVAVLKPYVECGLHVSDELAATVLDELQEVRQLLTDEGEAA